MSESYDGEDRITLQNAERLLTTLERLLSIEALDVTEALTEAAQIIGETLYADKVDAFLYHPESDSLIVEGLSDTEMSQREVALGLNRLPLSNGGRAVEVYHTGQPFASGQLELDPEEVPGMVGALGVRSIVAAPLEVAGERRGVIQVASSRGHAFCEADVGFVIAAARWAGQLAHRAELTEQTRRTAAEGERRTLAEELVTTLAHDLNNLLSPLKMHLELAERRARGDGRTQDQRDVASALTAVERLRHLTANLLDVARLDRGLFALAPVEFDVAALVRGTAGVYGGYGTGASPIRVKAPNELVIVGDPDRLRQALENLLANAVKHSPDGKVVIVTTQLVTRADGEEWAAITVSDRGPGISADLLPRIFERYVTDANSSGLGLGLYLTRQIAEAHGGTLTVSSVLGRGTRFELTFPRCARATPGADG